MSRHPQVDHDIALLFLIVFLFSALFLLGVGQTVPTSVAAQSPGNVVSESTLPKDVAAPLANSSQPEEDDYYRLITINATAAATESRSKRWKPAPEGVALEVSGMQSLGEGRLAVAIRKGEVWILERVYDDPPENVGYHRFASGLHEPLGSCERKRDSMSCSVAS
jgi:hypothetical protein